MGLGGTEHWASRGLGGSQALVFGSHSAPQHQVQTVSACPPRPCCSAGLHDSSSSFRNMRDVRVSTEQLLSLVTAEQAFVEVNCDSGV